VKKLTDAFAEISALSAAPPPMNCAKPSAAAGKRRIPSNIQIYAEIRRRSINP
jgi:hypothetical protein